MRVLLIDGLNLIRRVHAGVPEPADTPGGDATAAHAAAVDDALLRSVGRALRENEPTHAMLVMDAAAPGWRAELYPAYKQQRAPMPDSLRTHLDAHVESIAGLGPKAVRVAGFEADDVIATIACKLRARDVPVVVLSTDKSMLMLLSDGVEVRDHFAGRSFSPDDVHTRFGVQPGQLAAFLALAGDASQNVPGVRGIGAKSAARMLQGHATIDSVIDAAKPDDRYQKMLLAQADDARLFARISMLKTDVDVGLNLNAFRI